MTEKLRRILTRQSEVREKLNAETAKDTPDDPTLTELRTKAQGIEVELREALVDDKPADDDDGEHIEIDTEERERREIRSRATLATFVSKCANGERVEGAEAEYAAACGCAGAMPLSMLEPEHREIEHRAVTPGQDVAAGSQSPIPYVFQQTVANMLGVTFPSVPVGSKSYPVLSSPPPAGPKAKDAAAVSTAAAFTLSSRTPKRVTGQFLVRREDLATMDGMESALRGAMVDAISSSLDTQVLTGNNTAPNLNGLFHQATDVDADTSVETFGTGVARFAAVVDGRYANSMSDLRAVIGVETYTLYASLFRNGSAGSLFDYLSEKLAGIVVSSRAPAASGNAQKGIVVRQRGSQIVEVPTWQGIDLIRDEFTEAKKGQIVLTAYVLVGDPHVPYSTDTLIEVHPKVS